MGANQNNPHIIEQTWGRFFFHWSMTTMGFFSRILLPLMYDWWSEPNGGPVSFPRFYIAIIYSALVTLVGATINSNLPITPREAAKSIGIGYALQDFAVNIGGQD